MATETRGRLDAAALNAMVGGLYRTQLLYVIARLGIPERVAESPRTAAELATAAGADPDALFRVLRAVASLGVLSQDGQDRFGPTPVSELLRPGAKGSLHARLILYGEPWWWAPAGGLLETVLTGTPAFERVHDESLFEWLAAHPEASTTFDAHMTAMTDAEAGAVVGLDVWPTAGTVVDIGGGRGTLLASLLGPRPELQGVLFDQPHVIEHAGAWLDAAGVAGRLPAAWPATSSKRSRAAPSSTCSRTSCTIGTTSARGRSCAPCVPPFPTADGLPVIERVIPPGDTPAPGKLVDVTMLLITGGRERTRDGTRPCSKPAVSRPRRSFPHPRHGRHRPRDPHRPDRVRRPAYLCCSPWYGNQA